MQDYLQPPPSAWVSCPIVKPVSPDTLLKSLMLCPAVAPTVGEVVCKNLRCQPMHLINCLPQIQHFVLVCPSVQWPYFTVLPKLFNLPADNVTPMFSLFAVWAYLFNPVLVSSKSSPKSSKCLPTVFISWAVFHRACATDAMPGPPSAFTNACNVFPGTTPGTIPFANASN